MTWAIKQGLPSQDHCHPLTSTHSTHGNDDPRWWWAWWEQWCCMMYWHKWKVKIRVWFPCLILFLISCCNPLWRSMSIFSVVKSFAEPIIEQSYNKQRRNQGATHNLYAGVCTTVQAIILPIVTVIIHKHDKPSLTITQSILIISSH